MIVPPTAVIVLARISLRNLFAEMNVVVVVVVSIIIIIIIIVIIIIIITIIIPISNMLMAPPSLSSLMDMMIVI